MYTSINGELCKIDKAYSGEIVILQNEFLKLNSVLGDTKLLPQRKKIENPHPLLQTTVEPSKPEQREMLLDALLEISDSDPRSEEHTSELQSRFDLVCRLLL